MPKETDTTIDYRLSEDCWQDFPERIARIVETSTTTTVCEVGGGARPALALDLVERLGLQYTVLDVSADELAKAPEGYAKVHLDIAGADLDPEHVGRFDLVFSKTLAEHVRDAERFHRNVHALLRPGGYAVHLFPTMFAPAFVVNRLLPAAVTRWMLRKVQGSRRDDQGLEGKFPAYYRWCRGPSRKQVERLRGIGYDVVEYRGYFGTPGYYRPLRMAWLDDMVSTWLRRFPLASLTSYAVVVLRRPTVAAAEQIAPGGVAEATGSGERRIRH